MDKIIDNGSEGQIGEMPINNSDLLASQNFIKVGNLLYSYDTATKTATLIDGRHRNDNVTIPDTISIGGKLYIVTSIADQAFYGSGITSVTISGRLTKIGRSAFARCEHLIHVSLSANVKIIGDYAFSRCYQLQEVHISDIAAWCNIDFKLHKHWKSFANPLRQAHKLYLGDKLIRDLVIPVGVTRINNCAFVECYNLTSITIPDSVTSIGHFAFDGCGLKTLTIPESVDKIGADAFKCYGLTAIYCLRQKPTPINIETFTNYNATVYVPSGFINAYRKDAAWGQFKNIIETSDLPQHVNASSRNTQN